MSTLYVMEAVNMYCGDDDPNASQHLRIAELKLPPLEEIFADHHAGGSRFQVEVGLGVQKLVPTMKLNGWQPEVLSLFGLGARSSKVYSAYGVIRDKRSGRAIEAKAIIEGRLGKVEADAFQRGELQGHDYAINEVMHYELWFDEKEKYYFDWFADDWRVDGVSQNADERRILRVPSGSAV